MVVNTSNDPPATIEKCTSVESNAAFNVPKRVIYKVLTDADEMTRLALGAKAEFVSRPSFRISFKKTGLQALGKR